jgi:1-aminocyclopropane-1-carboxylate deaminase/D-cysteine desulfhydrase-like pyridoxal-dependent ACC family enzyme
MQIDKIFHASSSAGTQAGLVIGQQLSGWDGEIIGISVDVPEKELMENVYQLASEGGELIDTEVDRSIIEADDSYIGEGYGIKTRACEDAVDLFAQQEGVFLDYVYTGKAASGMLDYCRSGRIDKSENVLFLHTGGNIEIFE